MQILKLSIMLCTLIITHVTIPMDNPISKVVDYFVTHDRLQCIMCAHSTEITEQHDFIYHLARHLPLRLRCPDCNTVLGSLKKVHVHFTENPLCNIKSYEMTGDSLKAIESIREMRLKIAHNRAIRIYCTAWLLMGSEADMSDIDYGDFCGKEQ